MRRHPVWHVVRLGLLVGGVYAIWRVVGANRRVDDTGWAAQPFPFLALPRTVPAEVGEPHPWVEAIDGTCPPSHPIKGKLASGIYHEPGGSSYARTIPDRCYRDPRAAEADGLRAAKH